MLIGFILVPHMSVPVICLHVFINKDSVNPERGNKPLDWTLYTKSALAY